MFLQFSAKNIVLLTGLISWFALPSIAQVTPDNTTSTTITNDGAQTTINDGDRSGDNLFHSFRDFSLPNGGEAFFNNANDIVNIFSRVTGGNVSNIDGLLRANGGANLFLINPAGILFGNNARLDIGGSFYGTSADSILFEDGEFSATDLDNPPLLTINAPIGLNFRDNPGEITVRGSNLAVNSGQSLTLIGGNLSLQEGARLFGFGGRVQLGGVSSSGIVNLDENLNLGFPEDISLADITLSDNATVNVSANNGGEIALFARNLALTNNSSLIAGIAQNTGSPNAQAGDITIAASGEITLDGNNVIFNRVENNGIGNAGNINISANSLILNNNSSIGGEIVGRGDSGNINFNIVNSIDINEGSSIRSLVDRNAVGNAGDITIDTGILRLSGGNNRSLIFANTRGTGDAGNLRINASDAISLTASSLLSQIESGATGNGGEVTVTTPSLTLIDDGLILTNSDGIGNSGDIKIESSGNVLLDRGQLQTRVREPGRGNAGNIVINTRSLTQRGENANILADNQAEGDAGNITINATDSVVLNGPVNLIISQIQDNVVGNAGNIDISSPLLSLNNFSLISSNVRRGSIGRAGDISVDVDTLQITNGAALDALTENNFQGGDINIEANLVELTDGGKIVTSADSGGNAGTINLNVAGDLIISNNNPPTPSPFEETVLRDLVLESGLFASTIGDATGNGGSIVVEANSIQLADNGSISATTSSGNGGNVTLDVEGILSLSNDSLISAESNGLGNGGNIKIDSNFVVAFPNENNDIRANAQQGQGGNINITTRSVFGIQERPSDDLTNDIDASSQFGLSGDVLINTSDIDATQGVVELSTNVVKEQETVATTCSSESRDNSSLTIQGKGGILPQPTDEFFVENIAIDNKLSSETENQSSSVEAAQYPPILTSKGAIYPARGVVVKPDGGIILTKYPTDNLDRGVVSTSKNCADN
jgi:filamentous hemagglutinin family protein